MARSAKALFRGSSFPAIAAFVATAVATTAHAATLTVGPIEQINLRTSTVTVLGQKFHVARTATIKSSTGAATTLGSLAPDTLVAIDGAETAQGQATVSSVTSLPQMNVPGATQLLVTGVVSSESSTGQIRVGNLLVDINATLTSDAPQFAVGGLVEIKGTQPNPGGLFLAQSIVPVSSLHASGLGGSGGAALSTAGLEGSGGAKVSVMGLEGSGARVSTAGLEGSGGAKVSTAGLEGGGLK